MDAACSSNSLPRGVQRRNTPNGGLEITPAALSEGHIPSGALKGGAETLYMGCWLGFFLLVLFFFFSLHLVVFMKANSYIRQWTHLQFNFYLNLVSAPQTLP